MTHSHKIAAYKQLMAEKGIGPATAAPPLWEMLWSYGVPLPPPLYMGFIPLTLLAGSFFGLIFGAVAWLLGNKGVHTISLEETGIVALVTGAFFGLTVAWFTRRLARKHGLGSWSAFGGSRLRY